MRLLDRYLLRKVLEPFFICFFGFVGIWLVFDLYDNGPDFIEAKASFGQVARFYVSQLPQIVVLALPIGLLLALLYALSRMSRYNEIIAMLTAGRGLMRLLLPLLGVGLIATGVCFVLNARWAPHAESIKERMLDQITRGKKAEAGPSLEAHLFRDRLNNRTWYVRRQRPNTNELGGVMIVEQDPQGNILTKWYASKAEYDPKAGTWTLVKGRRVDFELDGDVTKTDNFPMGFRTIRDWSETPWRIASSQVEAQNLSIGELREYLKFNADFPTVQLAPYRTTLADRWAFPWSCFVVIFIAAPLGIVFTRRGVLPGVTAALLIFFAMIILRYFCLALGKGARLEPTVAAWLPHVIFFAFGLLLLQLRGSSRTLSSLFGLK